MGFIGELKMKDSTILALSGIASITAISIACLFKGVDHVILATTVAAIAGLAGYELRARREKR